MTVLHEPRQQQGGFDLGTGHAGIDFYWPEMLPAMDMQWCVIALTCGYPAAERFQFTDDPRHRSLRQGCIPGKDAVKRLGAQKTGQQTHAGTGVSTIEW